MNQRLDIITALYAMVEQWRLDGWEVRQDTNDDIHVTKGGNTYMIVVEAPDSFKVTR